MNFRIHQIFISRKMCTVIIKLPKISNDGKFEKDKTVNV